MPSYVTRIATFELPVTDIEESVNWYAKMLNLVVQHKTEHDAMLSFNAKGIASIYLVRTDDPKRIHFENTQTKVIHSVIDFYTYNLEGFHKFLQDNGVDVGPLNVQGEFGGFGFKDPDGNLLSATNIVQIGQE
ncbi:VOC family protein [Bacillus sp. PS06]|uniref:VOC family protein n=1 Tax=Bacillus sp. PS06 TaxID=2764176 RepID=UPI00177C5C4F|nr:VOC family protein [Bacillus sp. PS06]MBD8069435.1 VOC family protein [Bacillus sp. PS06]